MSVTALGARLEPTDYEKKWESFRETGEWVDTGKGTVAGLTIRQNAVAKPFLRVDNPLLWAIGIVVIGIIVLRSRR